MVGNGEGYSARGGDDGLNAKDNVVRVGAWAAEGVREVAAA